MLLLLMSLGAWAEPGGGTPSNPLSWTTLDGEPAIQIDGASKAALVTLTARASLAELSWSWTVPVLVTGDDVLVIPLDIPPAAWLHPTAKSYVTDLRVHVEVDGFRWLRTGFLAWPSGALETPVVWTSAQMRSLAPQGVLDPALRTPDADPDDRLMPDVSDVVALPASNIYLTAEEVEP